MQVFYGHFRMGIHMLCFLIQLVFHLSKSQSKFAYRFNIQTLKDASPIKEHNTCIDEDGVLAWFVELPPDSNSESKFITETDVLPDSTPSSGLDISYKNK